MRNTSTKINSPANWYAILSVALVLVLFGFFGLIFIQSNVLITNLKEQVNIILELKDDLEKDEIADIRAKLGKSVFVKTESIQFTSKEAAMELLREDFGSDFMQLDMINPLHDVFIFNVKAEYLNEASLALIKSKIQDNLNVRDVYYQENLVDAVTSNISKIAWAGLAIALFFLMVAVFLIHSTMRLAIHSNRFLIKNMELVGASWAFISRPFMLKSLKNGLLSAIIALVLLALIFYGLKYQIPQLNLFQDLASVIGLSLLILSLGVLISGFSTYQVVRKYLLMRLDDLYN